MAYLLFSGYRRQEGGAEDLQGRFESIEVAMAEHDLGKNDNEWANILCMDSLKIVKKCLYGEWYEDPAM